jgi:ketopantoate reductase
MKNIAIIGMGALGLLYGDMLQTAFNVWEVKAMESRLLAEAEHDCCRDKTANGTGDGSD